ncbi:MAG: hypothetical protein C0412_15225 [Flavobacterium sp.]|nr:hypothetical protein [Flavobacterium sp.]
MEKIKRNVQGIEELLKKNNIDFNVVNYSSGVKNANEAAMETGLDLEKMIKTLIFKSDDKYLALLIPSPKKVNTQQVNQKLGLKINMASPKEILEVTGCEIGTVTILGLKNKLSIYVDSSVMKYDTIGIASGVKGAEILMNPDDLRKITGAEVMELI